MPINPLLEFARKPEFTIKLPSGKNHYPSDTVEYTLNGEIEIYPMTPKDELILMNPDSLLSGDANIKVIESCAPSVKKAGSLYYPDANAILLAIQKATYGDKLNIFYKCPKCQEKAALLASKEEIDKAIQNNEIKLEYQETEFDIDELLSSMTFLEEDYVYKTENGLKIHYHPTLLKNKMEYELSNFNNRKILEYYKDYNFKDYAYDKEKKETLMQIKKLYLEMNDYGNKIITDCITRIDLPDGSFIEDKDLILEYIENTKSTIVNGLHKKILEINDLGIPSQIDFECDYCHHIWQDRLSGYNQVDFFGISSYF